MFRPALVLAFIAFLAWLLLECSSAEAAELSLEPTPPELRVGLHAVGKAEDPWISHLMFPNILGGTDATLYLGKKWRLSEYSSLETLLGSGLSTDGMSPVASLRYERVSVLTYVWADLEYAPLAHHNVYGYVTLAWRINPKIMLGLDTENWVNLERPVNQPVDAYWSVGPTVGFKVGPNLFLQEALLWTGDSLIPRTYAQYWF